MQNMESTGRSCINRRAQLSLIIVIATLYFFPYPAVARDLEKLARLLTPAYMAQNFVSVCSDREGRFLSELNASVSSILDFAGHVNQEVTLNLSDKEAFQVRLMAANVARTEVRTQLNPFRGGDPSIQEKAFREWCLYSIEPYVAGIVRVHQDRHADFNEQVEAAKK